MGELSVRELPLFPLPEVVLFPQEVLPLHIFESVSYTHLRAHET